MFMNAVSVIIPAYNEEDYLEYTLSAIRESDWATELIVINDGSNDRTGEIAKKLADQYIGFDENRGKGEALKAGFERANYEIIVCLDADLGVTASEGRKLVAPLFADKEIDSVIGRLPVQKKRGFGMVRRRASALIYNETGVKIEAPLSGQRSIRKKWLPIIRESIFLGYGVETVLTMKLLQHGAKLVEVDVDMKHRQYGKNFAGLMHRAKQWYDIEKSVWKACR